MAPQNVSTQPAAGPVMQMNIQPTIDEAQSQKQGTLASRLRGGGAGKDCLLGAIGCFLCCECFEGCCECVADIICCPCEMCC